MGAQGTVELDFGAFPGVSDASIAVAQAGVSNHPTSLAEAWLIPVATADHLADEHLIETIRVFAGPCVAGVGFTVYGANASQVNEGLELVRGNLTSGLAPTGAAAPQVGTQGGIGTRLYGKWTCGWAWN